MYTHGNDTHDTQPFGRGERGPGRPGDRRFRMRGGEDRRGGGPRRYSRGGPHERPMGPRRARRGDIRAAILSLLSNEPHNGYQLIKSIAETTDGTWSPSPGSVYPTLAQLKDEGLIAETGDEGRPAFELTEEGRAYVAAHTEELARAWESATGGASDTELAFQASALKLTGVLKQLRHAATDEQRTAATKAMDDARKALYLILAE